MQWILLVMLVSANGDMQYKEPVVFYSKKACVNAMDALRTLVPRNATFSVVSQCVTRGGKE